MLLSWSFRLSIGAYGIYDTLKIEPACTLKVIDLSSASPAMLAPSIGIDKRKACFNKEARFFDKAYRYRAFPHVRIHAYVIKKKHSRKKLKFGK